MMREGRKEGRRRGNTPIFLLLLFLFRTRVVVEEEEMPV